MSYNNLTDFVKSLEKNNELIRIKEFVNPYLEISEITDRISKSNNNKALLFENTKTIFPILINSLGSYKRMCLAFKVKDLDEITQEINKLFNKLTLPKESILEKLKLIPELKKIGDYMPKKISGKGICQQNIMQEIDLYKLPVLTCWPKDGGPFITLPIIHTINPLTNIRNVGMYRMQVFSKTTTGMHWHKHKVSAKHFNEYKKLNKKMPVAVALGGDPVYTYSATAPLPENVDEYLLAGFIRKKRVELVQCITQPDIWVPNDADIIIEGFVDVNEDLILEGPFGDHTGFYSLADYYPKFNVTAITYKKNAIYPTTIVGIPPQEDAWIGKATERIFLAPIKMTLCPEILDMDMPIEGVFHNLVITKINKDFVGQASKVMNAMWGAGQMMFNKILVIADELADIKNYISLLQNNLINFNPKLDVHITKGAMDVLDHSCSKFAYGGKMCIDLTKKIEEEIDENYLNILPNENVELDILEIDKDVVNVNVDLYKILQLPILFINIIKNKPKQIEKLHQNLCKLKIIEGFKIVAYFDKEIDIKDISLSLWVLANNIDPSRDIYIESNQCSTDNNKYFSCMGIDATIKLNDLDGFSRDWPNVVVSDNNTINEIDKKWSKLNLGKFIPSPSLKYKQLIRGNKANI